MKTKKNQPKTEKPRIRLQDLDAKPIAQDVRGGVGQNWGDPKKPRRPWAY